MLTCSCQEARAGDGSSGALTDVAGRVEANGDFAVQLLGQDGRDHVHWKGSRQVRILSSLPVRGHQGSGIYIR